MGERQPIIRPNFPEKCMQNEDPPLQTFAPKPIPPDNIQPNPNPNLLRLLGFLNFNFEKGGGEVGGQNFYAYRIGGGG